MQRMDSDWYRIIWTLDIQNQSWVEDTKRQVDFIIKNLNLTGKERVLDLACGFGRHSLELARRGFDVTGIDITPEYVVFASDQALREHLNAHFLCEDIRQLHYMGEFDVVLNMADGAIGYLENDEEKQTIFEVMSEALRPGGKHLMDIMNANYARTHFPCKLWDAGEKGLTLSQFEWEDDTKTLIYGQKDFPYGDVLHKPEILEGNPIRLYSIEEIQQIYTSLGMRVTQCFADFSGHKLTDNDIQMIVCSVKSKLGC